MTLDVAARADEFRESVEGLDAHAARRMLAAYQAAYKEMKDRLEQYTNLRERLERELLGDKERWAAKRATASPFSIYAKSDEEIARWFKTQGRAEFERLLQAQAAAEFQSKRWAETAMAIQETMKRYADVAEGIVTDAQGNAISLGTDDMGRLIEGQLPESLGYSFSRPDDGALRAMVGFTGADTPLSNLFGRLAPEMMNMARQTLMNAVALGTPPRVVARQLDGPLGIPLWRSLTIARTETLRSYREAQRATIASNADVLEGWVWRSARGRRTCEVCWSMDGKVFPIGTVSADKTMPMQRPTDPRAAAVWDIVRKAQAAEPSITADIETIGAALGIDPNGSFTMLHGPNAGKTLHTLDARLKTYESSLRKASEDYGQTPPEELAGQMKDNVRYTYLATRDNIVEKAQAATARLQEYGYTPYIAKLPLQSGYWGINTWWQDKDGQVFEVQFHTQATLETKEVYGHPLYEEERRLPAESPRKAEVLRLINELWAQTRIEHNLDILREEMAWLYDYYETVK